MKSIQRAITLFAPILCLPLLGCLVEAEPDDPDASSVMVADPELELDESLSADDVALDAVYGDELFEGGDGLDDGALYATSDDRGGPDPTPWKLTSGPEDGSGPDPTPWEEGAKGDGQGPDPTPWKSGSDESQPSGEPDPQPWQATRLRDRRQKRD